MPFHDLSLLEIVCAPDSEEKLEEIEPWLLGDSTDLFPILCRTPILQPNIEAFLKSELWNLTRAFAEMDEQGEGKAWYFSRYGFFNVPDPPPLDTEILGEGYPGFWGTVEISEFLKEFNFEKPENFILDTIAGHQYKIGLDLGCGQGGMTQLMSDSCRQVLGLETNFYLAATANRLLRSNEITIRYFIPEKGYRTVVLEKKPVTNAQVVCGDVRAMPFCEPLFDWVHCGHILDLVDDPARVLVQAKKIMKPGATLSICTPWDIPDEGHFDNMLEILAQDFKQVRRVEGVPWLRFSHKRRYALHEDWIWVGKLKR